MYVQAFDKKTERYYKSIVYALFKCRATLPLGVPAELSDEELAVLYNPIDNCFELVPQLDISWKHVAGIPTMEHNLNYTVIQSTQIGWKALPEAILAQYTEARVVSVVGFSDIIDQDRKSVV